MEISLKCAKISNSFGNEERKNFMFLAKILNILAHLYVTFHCALCDIEMIFIIGKISIF